MHRCLVRLCNWLQKANATNLPRHYLKTIPHVRGWDEAFQPVSLDAAMASEKALRLALTEITIQGVASHRVKDILQTLWGLQISAMEVIPDNNRTSFGATALA